MTAELVLRWSGGELDMMGWNSGPHGDFLLETLADGTDWGNPEPVRRALRRFLMDGSAAVKDYDDNRTIPLSLRVTAADGTALAGGEVPLAQADGRRCELVWTPPDVFSAPAVFVAVSSDLRHKMDDLAETRKPPQRFYTLTLDCLPHSYSDEWVTIPAVAQGSSTPTTVNAMTSLTNWTAAGATLSLAGVVGIRLAPVGAPLSFSATYTAAVDLTTQPYLGVACDKPPKLVEVLNSAGWAALPSVGLDGAATIYDGTGLADRTIDAIRITHSAIGEDPGYRHINALRKQATPRSAAARQQVRTLEVPGSARTPATLLVESPTLGVGLETVLLYSGPSYNPDVARGAVDGRAPDPTNRLSGAYSLIDDGSSHRFDIPVSDFHQGDHSLWGVARVRDATSTGLLTVTVKTLTATGVEASSEVVSTTRVSGPSTLYRTQLLGSAELPPMALPTSSTAVVRFVLSWDYDGPALDPALNQVEVDTVLAFNRTLGNLTVAEASDYRRLWLESPTLQHDVPAVYVSNGDRIDAVALSLATQLPAWPGVHSIEPPVTYLYAASTGVTDAEVSGTFRPAWHTHPAS